MCLCHRSPPTFFVGICLVQKIIIIVSPMSAVYHLHTLFLDVEKVLNLKLCQVSILNRVHLCLLNQNAAQLTFLPNIIVITANDNSILAKKTTCLSCHILGTECNYPPTPGHITPLRGLGTLNRSDS